MNFASLVQIISGAAWLAVIALFVVISARASRGQPLKGLLSTVLIVVVVAVLLTSVGAGLVFLQSDEYGVVISALVPNGYRNEPIGPGLHWIVPFAESVRTYSISKQTYTM